jgi:hypothetical protein
MPVPALADEPVAARLEPAELRALRLPDTTTGARPMDAEQIVKLTPDAVATLLESRRFDAVQKQLPGKRMEERWPFPGTVEAWLPDHCYGERHLLATLHNLSPHGLAMRVRRPIPTETKLALAIHQPELSCYGHGVVRHCTRGPIGYLVGIEFCFTEDEAGSNGQTPHA